MTSGKAEMLERLFTSRVRVQLMAHFLLRPGAGDHIRALASRIGAQYNAVWKELNNLEEVGLLHSEAVGGRKIYRLNSSFPLLPELRAIVLKTVGAGDRVREAIGQLNDIDAAFIFGSFAGGTPDAESDLDLLIIGDVDLDVLGSAVEEIEGSLDRALNYVTYTRDEWGARLAAGDPFIHRVIREPKIMLKGDADAIREAPAGGADPET